VCSDVFTIVSAAVEPETYMLSAVWCAYKSWLCCRWLSGSSHSLTASGSRWPVSASASVAVGSADAPERCSSGCGCTARNLNSCSLSRTACKAGSLISNLHKLTSTCTIHKEHGHHIVMQHAAVNSRTRIHQAVQGALALLLGGRPPQCKMSHPICTLDMIRA
jgi:hypothetical protein